MTKTQLDESAGAKRELLENGIRILRTNPVLLDMVTHFNGTNYSLKDFETWEDCKLALTFLRRAGIELELELYFLGGFSTLAISYTATVGGYRASVTMYCKETEVALKSLSAGKCKIKEVKHTKDEVVCEVSDE